MHTAAQRIADWALGLRLDDVPGDVLDHAKLHILDTLGCGLAAHALGAATEGRAAMIAQGGTPESSVIGCDARLPAPGAAFANAMLCHALDFDDSHSDSICKPSTVSFPAALAATEAAGRGGADALVATVAANEVTTRIGMAAPGAFHARGFHPTAVCGVFGAAAAAARLAGLSAEEASNTLGIAGSFAAGILACLDEGTATKPMHAGWAAHGGVLAAQLASLGAEGPRSVLEGKHGLYRTFLGTAPDEVDVERQLDDLGSRWETARISFKPFPACHFSHGVLGAAARATGGRTFEAHEIAEVVVSIPAAGVSLVLEPIEERRAPRSTYDAQFSLPYSVASMLVRGHVALDDFTSDAIADPDVLALAAKVGYEARDYASYPGAFPGGIRVRLTSGEMLEAELAFQEGSPENPLAPDAVRAKFRRNAGLALADEALDALEEAILSLEEQQPADLSAVLATPVIGLGGAGLSTTQLERRPMQTAAQQIADWSSAISIDDIPTEVLEHAKLHLLDVIGCGYAASALGVATEGRTAMAELGGESQASVIGHDGARPAPNAAFANAMLCHGLDYDDMHSDSVSHVSVVVCPAALATAEAQSSSGADLLAAIVGGNEVVARVGMAASGLFHKRGFHPTAICGIFGGTAAAARLLGADAATTVSALGIAGSFAGGLFAYLDDATATKPFHPAWAAHGSTLAARLAALGGEGPPGVIEGRFGLYHAFIGADKGEVDIDSQLADLGRRWETPRIAYKPYPACHFIHGSLGATATLLDGLQPEEIEEVVVWVPEAGVSLVLEPAASKVAPRSEYEAKFSLQYSTAAMLVHGQVGVKSYTDEAIADPRVLDLARKVRYETKEYATYPAAFPGGVRIRTRDGRTLEADFPYQRGGPENPMSPDEVRAKFRENASLALSDEAVEALEETILALEERQDVRGLLRQRVPA